MRRAIEVYLKKNRYAAYIASIHLAAIRFCLLGTAKQTQGFGNSTDISFAGKLWHVFAP